MKNSTLLPNIRKCWATLKLLSETNCTVITDSLNHKFKNVFKSLFTNLLSLLNELHHPFLHNKQLKQM